MKKLLIGIPAVMLFVTACQKDDNPSPETDVATEQVLDNYVNGLVLPNLQDLNNQATAMNEAVNAFIAMKDEASLEAAQQSWYDTRTAWEQSEAMLFGPVEDNNYDPRIDSWPVDYTAIQKVWDGTQPFSESYINGLADELKGFHPIEFILFGKEGDAQPSDFTDERQIGYLQAMSLNLKHITDSLYHAWLPSAGNFAANILEAGSSGSKYASTQTAFIEIANAMIAIVDEVGNGKLKAPFDARDPLQEESPFSKNSFADFKNNIIGAQNVYLGRYKGEEGPSLSDLVAQYNRSLDAKIQKQLQDAVNNLGSYEVPYGEAIIGQRSQVQASMDLLGNLQSTLEDEFIPLIQLHVK